MAEKKVKFETAMKDLEALVEALESGDRPLDQALADYEKGMKLVRTCNRILEEAEARVEVIRTTENGVTTEPFDKEESHGS